MNMSFAHFNPALQIGDAIPMDRTADDRALCGAGTPRWHCLIVAPQREHQAEAWLRGRGVYAFHPVRHRKTMVRGKPRLIESRYLPGYVFAGFPGPVIWHKVFASLFVNDAIRLAHGEPGQLREVDLQQIMAMRATDEAAEAQARDRIARARLALRVSVGDKARIRGGALDCQVVEVVVLGQGRATVRLSLFGASHEADVDAGLLDKL